eukprot:CAMPEP_0182932646 /NCGR_PEP_ID=MMETSP0105_2-20130417/31864_1 /TAXON_ID=81532 ORGANISM="Acanthoeca-like sp., Strain 10tr" /NCGR_SAMPLE_ID=MMETSP0105_2 /ASSEMBLY_ACC=CAM_ASM_000205 /LENGTH=80 /DNA_ID=CAMNT_0025071271 /DNA_START=1038 /DNA_END=1276 /DNA_ORIENTATION=-
MRAARGTARSSSATVYTDPGLSEQMPRIGNVGWVCARCPSSSTTSAHQTATNGRLIIAPTMQQQQQRQVLVGPQPRTATR